MMHLLALGFSIALTVLGQFFLKTGSLSKAEGLRLFLHPATLAGLFSYGFASLFYIVALRKIPLSIAYPSVSLSYVAVVVLAHFAWGEPLGLRQGTALFLIISGIALLYKA
ncbi:MAG: EamA family transporter [Synergistaceae bacterium]|jgi:drug/metabolite transporter (DMT)-like permease|nr:EamA family transporter [Synergistaceae bacterium]